MKHSRLGAVLVTVLVLAACGSSSTVHLAHSPSPRASSQPSSSPAAAFPSPSPGVTSSVPPVGVSCASAPAAGERLVLVRLRGISGVVVRDITDLDHPVTRCTIAGGSYFRFYDATHVSYIVTSGGSLGADGALYLANLTTGTTSLVRGWTNGGFASWVYAWSPDGRALSYISSDNSGAAWHLQSSAGDRTLLDLGQIPGRGVNPDTDDEMVGFSADGKYVAIEQTFAQGKSGSSVPPIQVDRVADASVAYSRTDGTMAAWAGAGEKLYFRTPAGVQSWDPANNVMNVSSGTVWIHPMASPDGARIAFSVLNAQQNHVGEVLDLTSGAVRALSPNPRVGAAFLNSSLVWYAGESICTTATPCGLGGPALTGQAYIYDLGSDVEYASVDTALFDSWPHVVGQS